MKKAIIVGDPMQLTHIAGITKGIDRGLAKMYGLTEMKDIYPGYMNKRPQKTPPNHEDGPVRLHPRSYFWFLYQKQVCLAWE